ncbi:hypothetical protein AVEN_140451-1 [Araneus ventricosus]|uniref:Uncharacterized protein n=1 Tax=Araneus ventricosus TaxID=182803 RepID=A0A4Y2MEG9_ARAVE|nr:hypothetical protein AVEN_140451-1 [Araneus ventricosus]
MVKASKEISVSVLNFFSAFEQGSQPSNSLNQKCQGYIHHQRFFLTHICILHKQKKFFSHPCSIYSFLLQVTTVNARIFVESLGRGTDLVISAPVDYVWNFPGTTFKPQVHIRLKHQVSLVSLLFHLWLS